ncbi:Two-component system, response regulator, LytTR family [Alteracholeplasma palmae J233]|uniref:Two-component system, response regulator, LytTR family n=1 Tax=Alteracholeplasma palmae (strain ATCC 49389 / J233) TaxID=1318466 RepID=U4KRK3_ALTPJ|nr:LytTR family DNA-binding domain-containing protein [Alteracholeplasma palmae]CCV64241.1 Two-component system, response regulator, LytTR family [Alteracholeplasma palmae J233]
MIINIAICDDNQDILSYYTKIVQSISTVHIVNVDSFSNSMDLLDRVESKINYYHLIILDVEMPFSNGIEVSKQLREKGYQNEIIFLTNYIDYAYEAFDTYPFHYLHKKTLTVDKLKSILSKAFSLQDKKQSEVFTAVSKGETKIIPYSSISCFEVQGRYSVVYYDQSKSFEFIQTIQEIESKLPEDTFIRVHRSYIINMAYLDSFQGKDIKLKNDLIIPIGITHKKKVKELFNKYLIHKLEQE